MPCISTQGFYTVIQGIINKGHLKKGSDDDRGELESLFSLLILGRPVGISLRVLGCRVGGGLDS